MPASPLAIPTGEAARVPVEVRTALSGLPLVKMEARLDDLRGLLQEGA